MQSTPKAKFDQQTVDTAIENLKAMPPAPRETKQLTIGQAIKEMTPTIALLIRRGYSRERVVELLKEQGIECSPATFRSLYRAPKRRRSEATSTTTPASTRAATSRPSESAASGVSAATLPAPSKLPAPSTPSVPRGEARGVVGGAPHTTAKAS